MMRMYICLLLLTLPFQAWAAPAILKITGEKVTLSDDQPFARGQWLNFMGSDLSVKATGVVETVSPAGTTAVVRVTGGKVDSDQIFERVAANTGAKRQSPGVGTMETMTADERKVLARGEISSGSYIAGGLVGSFLGLGIGHAIQGRYSSPGWIFTAGEVAAIGVIVAAAADSCSYDFERGYNRCSSNSVGLGVTALVALTGLRIWEIIDLWASPPSHNREYRRLTNRQTASWSPVLTPSRQGDLAFGLQLRF